MSRSLDRGNTSTGSYVIQMAGADDVTLDHLDITGAVHGIYASDSADSDHLTIQNSKIYDNNDRGVYLRNTNDQPVLSDNELYGQSYGIQLEYGTAPP